MTRTYSAHAMVPTKPNRSKPFNRPRRFGLALALTIALLIAALVADAALAAPAHALTPTKKMVNLINDTRRRHGLRALHIGARMLRVARRHSRHMARAGSLFHSSNLQRKLPGRTWGENVGVTSRSLRGMHRAFMRSSSHRSNILSNRYNRLGVGVVSKGRRTWVTEVFAG